MTVDIFVQVWNRYSTDFGRAESLLSVESVLKMVFLANERQANGMRSTRETSDVRLPLLLLVPFRRRRAFEEHIVVVIVNWILLNVEMFE